MLDVDAMAIDTDRIDGGQWVGDIPLPEFEGVRLKVRGLKSIAYQDELARQLRTIPRSDRERDGSVKLHAMIACQKRAMSRSILLDWSGLSSAGEELKYDKDIAFRWLTNRKTEFFADAVTWAAQAVDRDEAEIKEEIVKNSVRSSSGKPSGPAKATT